MLSLHISGDATRLEYEAGAISIRDNHNRPRCVPVRSLERIVIDGDCLVSSRALREINQSGGQITFIGRDAASACTLSLDPAHGDARRRLAQYAAYHDPRSRLIWTRHLVTRKLLGQLRLLTQLAQPASRRQCHQAQQQVESQIDKLRHKPLTDLDMETIQGSEGIAARHYFNAYATLFPQSLGFTTRNRRPPRDPVNACLSLGYTLAYNLIVKLIQQHGLDPYIGMLHEVSHGRPSLSCDLIEPVRPVVDRFVWQLFHERQLRQRDFSLTDEAGCRLQPPARARFYRAYHRLQPKLGLETGKRLQLLRDWLLAHHAPVSTRQDCPGANRGRW